MNAATKIQASFRGHMARKQAEKQSKNDSEISKEMEKLQSKVMSTNASSDGGRVLIIYLTLNLTPAEPSGQRRGAGRWLEWPIAEPRRHQNPSLFPWSHDEEDSSQRLNKTKRSEQKMWKTQLIRELINLNFIQPAKLPTRGSLKKNRPIFVSYTPLDSSYFGKETWKESCIQSIYERWTTKKK